MNARPTAYRKDVQPRSSELATTYGFLRFPPSILCLTPKRDVATSRATAYLKHLLDLISSSSRSALETLEVLLSIILAVAAWILIARKFKDRLLGLIGLAVAFSIIEAFFAPPLALTSIGVAVLAFLVYVISKTEMVALTPLSREELLKNRDEFRRRRTAVEVE
jgi:hypothetical protein